MQLSTHEILVLLGSVLGGGVAVSLLAQAVKKSGLVKDLVHIFVVALSAIGAVAQYLVQYHSKLPVTFLGISGASIYGVSQLVYNWSKTANGFLAKAYGSNSSTTVTGTTTTTATAPIAPAAASDEEQPSTFAG